MKERNCVKKLETPKERNKKYKINERSTKKKKKTDAKSRPKI